MSVREIQVHRGYVAIIDEADADLVCQYKWYATKPRNKRGSVYPFAYQYLGYHSHKFVRMHRLILGLTDPAQQVDHANGNPLDNRRENLRLCNQFENARNRIRERGVSGFRGVTRNRKDCPLRPWQARIAVDKRVIFIGSFAEPEEAARAYDAAAIELHGEFAQLNFPKKICV